MRHGNRKTRTREVVRNARKRVVTDALCETAWKESASEMVCSTAPNQPRVYTGSTATPSHIGTFTVWSCIRRIL